LKGETITLGLKDQRHNPFALVFRMIGLFNAGRFMRAVMASRSRLTAA